MLLTFEKIREIQLEEKSSELQSLPDGFFSDVLEYLKLKGDSDEGRTAQRLLGNLLERRLKKIVTLASMYYSTDRQPENLEKDEQELYSGIVSLLKKREGEFRKRLKLEPAPKEVSFEEPLKKENPPEKRQAVSSEAPAGSPETMVRVVFSSDTPELMTPEMEVCSFRKGDSAEITRAFAEFLEKKGFCRKSN